MNKFQIKKQKYIRERKLKRRTFLNIIIHIIILILFCIYTKEVNESYNYATIKPYDHMDSYQECYDAVYAVMKTEYDYSDVALYFESCKNKDNQHSRNLEFICESDGMRFYK